MYYIYNRYQDEGWEFTNQFFTDYYVAEKCAEEMAKDPICYGMVKITDERGNDIAIYAAGGSRVT